ncbi:PREDICTED: LEAF RUST 10 DISEASE-RESISTANCE LOCUS RECEPTOR-LIKE PROTEIN KINASE-like 1.4 isoform X3 [Lupinus angustifolius]|uniref:LEAF RUST 10 DISEASE-RESISTANCE LOCUS RECEPTOR-LIKE PROTEIN KINASE-like 1.4 isoform X3 n=1 Tax=Lupinus angustifolius TaxID=3871 RepID=UPI00092FBA7D|nr:PREDICTED: LEAF RUST 10 DISEASE-RESISTANCE LOCUS RECEPTOR-LIKE PROTEIN KINASE-like 1.4 isoform X3 [Lupinus angustifolius]
MINRLPKFAFASIVLLSISVSNLLCISKPIFMFLKMHLIHPTMFFSFLIIFISITLSQIPTLLCDVHDDLPCTSFDCEIVKKNTVLCDECKISGGSCSYSPETGLFITCYCKNGSFPSSCPLGGKKSKVGVAIGAAAGAVALVAILGIVWFMVKRKKKVAAAKQPRSEDLFTPPSSNGAFTSTTNMSQSVPSYTSSKTDSVPPMKSFYFGVQVFTIDELEEATDNFNPSRELGDGGFGTVYKGELKDGRVVAVKRHYESNFKRVRQFMNEVEILARLRHKNLVTLFGCTSRHSRELLLVYEFISNGTVDDHLHGNRANSNFVSWPVRLNIAIETAEALAYLHASDVIHRDVKSNNILLDDNFCVKVADFGLSRLFPVDATHVSTAPQGTPGYVDPEYYQCYQLTDKSDVYSFGVVLIELISSLQAVDVSRHRNDVNLANMAVNKIQNQELHDLVDPNLGYDKDYGIRRMTTGVAELAFRCLQQQRDMRPSMDEVLEVLRGIKSDEFGATREADVVNVRTEEVMLLNNVHYPLSSTDSFDDKQQEMLRRTA